MIATIRGERLGGTTTRGVFGDKANWRKDMVEGAIMMSLGSREELEHTKLMVYLAEDLSICGTWSKRGRGAEAFVS